MVWPGFLFGGGLITCLYRVGLTKVSHKLSIPKLGFGYFIKINATGVGPVAVLIKHQGVGLFSIFGPPPP